MGNKRGVSKWVWVLIVLVLIVIIGLIVVFATDARFFVSDFLRDKEITGYYSKDCVDTDDGLNYNTKGATYYGNYSYIDSCVRSGGVVNAGTSFEYTLIEGSVMEYSCYDSGGDEKCRDKACKFTQYKCPNGCENGACI